MGADSPRHVTVFQDMALLWTGERTDQEPGDKFHNQQRVFTGPENYHFSVQY